MQIDPIHAAHLAQAQGALCALLREASADTGPNDAPTVVVVTLDGDGMTVEYKRGAITVGEEFV